MNTAVVPRIKKGKEGRLRHNYVLITMSEAMVVTKVQSVWLEKNHDGSFETVEATQWFPFTT